MTFNSFSLKPFCVVFLFLALSSCTTDDVAPTLIEVGSEETDLSEADGSITLTANLNGAVDQQLNIPLTLSGTATRDADYTLSSPELVIPSGSDSGEITITGLQDSEIEGVETIIISLGAVESLNTLSAFEITISVLDDDSDSDGDGVLDPDDDCVDIPGDAANNGCPFLGFIINEVLYDPASGSDGDANGDGTRDANEDEFIEFYNSGTELDISGYRVFDAEALANNTPRHVFPPGTVVPTNGVVVLFGGGNPSGDFGGAIVQATTDGEINMNNSGDFVTVQDADGNVVVTFDVEPLSNNPDESYTRSPDLTGDFAQHSSIDEANETLFSPGTRLDGTSF